MKITFAPTLFFLMLLGFASIFLVSCKTIKRPAPVTFTEIPDYNLIEDNAFSFQTFDARLSVDANLNGQRHTVTASLRMKKDEKIWVSVSPFLGIELFRVLITPDSVVAINRLENIYHASDISYLNELFKTQVDFEMLQAILTGNDFENYSYENVTVSKDNMPHVTFKSTRDASGNKNASFKHNLWFDTQQMKISRHFITDEKESYIFDINYAAFKEVDEHVLPHEVNMSINSGTDSIVLGITFSRVNINRDLSFPLRIPDNYKKMP